MTSLLQARAKLMSRNSATLDDVERAMFVVALDTKIPQVTRRTKRSPVDLNGEATVDLSVKPP